MHRERKIRNWRRSRQAARTDEKTPKPGASGLVFLVKQCAATTNDPYGLIWERRSRDRWRFIVKLSNEGSAARLYNNHRL